MIGKNAKLQRMQRAQTGKLCTECKEYHGKNAKEKMQVVQKLHHRMQKCKE